MAKKPVRKRAVGGAREGAGRPKSADPPVVVSGSVPASQAAKLDAWAAKNETTRANAVREAIRRFVS